MYGDSQKYAAGGLNSVLMQQDRMIDNGYASFAVFGILCCVYAVQHIDLVLFVWFPGSRLSCCYQGGTVKGKKETRKKNLVYSYTGLVRHYYRIYRDRSIDWPEVFA